MSSGRSEILGPGSPDQSNSAPRAASCSGCDPSAIRSCATCQKNTPRSPFSRANAAFRAADSASSYPNTADPSGAISHGTPVSSSYRRVQPFSVISSCRSRYAPPGSRVRGASFLLAYGSPTGNPRPYSGIPSASRSAGIFCSSSRNRNVVSTDSGAPSGCRDDGRNGALCPA
jgi:hypothetical protein